jgi:hypothetical protein
MGTCVRGKRRRGNDDGEKKTLVMFDLQTKLALLAPRSRGVRIGNLDMQALWWFVCKRYQPDRCDFYL